LVEDPDKRITIQEIKECRWYNGKALTQEQAAKALAKRKQQVDREKFKQGNGGQEISNRDIQCDLPTPLGYWNKEGPSSSFWFYSKFDAPTIQRHLTEAILNDLKGEVQLPKADDDLDLANLTGDADSDDEDDDDEELADGRSNPYTAKFTVIAENKKVQGVWNIYTEMLDKEHIGDLRQKYQKVHSILREKDAYLEMNRGELRARAEKQLELGEGELLTPNNLSIDEVKFARQMKKLENDFDKKKMEEHDLKNLKPYYTEDDRLKFGKRNIVVFRQNNSTPKKQIKKTLIERKDYNSHFFADVYKTIITLRGASLMEMEYEEEPDSSDEENNE